MGFHPGPVPDGAFASELLPSVGRRFEQEKVDSFFDRLALAPEAESGATERRDKFQAHQARLFADLAHGRLRQRLAQFLMALGKSPAAVGIFDEKNFHAAVAFAVDYSAGRNFPPAGSVPARLETFRVWPSR